MKNQKGITLITIIITILVMLILAGITLTLTISEDGVISKTEQAKVTQEIAQETEILDIKEISSFNISI